MSSWEKTMHGTFTFIGNATCLISVGDITLLTDPNFLHAGEYAYLGHGLVSKRLREPALSIDQLPPIDAVVLSHLHGDHWDRRAQKQLDRETPIITTGHAASKLGRRGFVDARPVKTWESETIERRGTRATVTSMPGRHGPRWAVAGHLVPPVMGSMIEFSRIDPGLESQNVELRIYISGDTLVVDDLLEIPRRYPSIDTGVFHLGGTTLPFGQSPRRGLMVTMDAQQGVRAIRMIDPDRAIPIHFDDYGVFSSPLDDFLREADADGIGDKVLYVERGRTVAIGKDRS
ncbi:MULTISPECIES: MBL fold metallo-hydrolase [unclassified Rhodococcus (in: high G+C Gram-positive bacteria)]|uniref:MBL fold metallo-hydrolase n=1 Tax=unclassified Rhodococcus (in: high G+C Gram-positive bacteria) TaxID=192944 RepID=UPI0021C0C56B|nr:MULTISPECIES: MBL fold metallo-hydrolase [unclassified Rhodococcus (in: high G+C Gram-positive bacteria)]